MMLDLLHEVMRFCIACSGADDAIPLGFGLLGGAAGAVGGRFTLSYSEDPTESPDPSSTPSEWGLPGGGSYSSDPGGNWVLRSPDGSMVEHVGGPHGFTEQVSPTGEVTIEWPDHLAVHGANPGSAAEHSGWDPYHDQQYTEDPTAR